MGCKDYRRRGTPSKSRLDITMYCTRIEDRSDSLFHFSRLAINYFYRPLSHLLWGISFSFISIVFVLLYCVQEQFYISEPNYVMVFYKTSCYSHCIQSFTYLYLLNIPVTRCILPHLIDLRGIGRPLVVSNRLLSMTIKEMVSSPTLVNSSLNIFHSSVSPTVWSRSLILVDSRRE